MKDPGYAIIPSVLDTADMDGLIEAASGNAERSRAGARHLLKNAQIAELAHDSRLTSIAGAILDGPAQPFRATYFDKSQLANWLVTWHQDTALPLTRRIETEGWWPWSVKAGITYAHAPAAALQNVIALRIHLDDSNACNGPLRVLPCSHLLGVLTEQEIDDLKRTIPPVDCLVPRGGVIAMRPLVVHASSKSTVAEPRRVIHIEYALSLKVAASLELAIA
jgi:ectoine hydroxylase-related dioxygenase (phytanoyl-CoA dioxygenase family)